MQETDGLLNKVNEIGIKGIKSRNKNLIGIFLMVLPFTIGLFYLEYRGLERQSSGLVFYLAVLLPVQLMLIFITVYVALLNAKRMNNTVQTILISGNIKIETFPILNRKSKTVDLIYEDIVRLSQRSFPWFGKEKLEGTTIKTKSGEEYYLIKNYFDDYDEILKLLNTGKIINPNSYGN